VNRFAVAAFVLAVIVTSEAATQQPFRATTDLVPVYVSVTGRDGRQISGLEQTDFTVTDGGKRQPIQFFSAARHPFAIAMVLDISTSMTMGAGVTRQMPAARALAEALDPDDEIALGSLTGPVVGLSPDKVNVSRLLRLAPSQIKSDTRPISEEESRRGLDWATSSLARYDGRRIVVMFSDGRSRPRDMQVADFAEFVSTFQEPAQVAEQLVRNAERTDVSIHAIAFDDTMVDELFLSAFARTGGGTSLIARDANLVTVAQELVHELHHEYLIGFVPTIFDGKSHKIQIKVSRPGATVRARASYLAPKR